MRIQAYTAYPGTLVITVATRRPEAMASTVFTAASIHEDFAAKVRGLLEEHKHVGETSEAYPAAQRLQNYFPAVGTPAKPLYALRQLMPAGAPRDIDTEWMLEIMRIRYEFSINLLPAAFAASQVNRNAIERHVAYAVKKLFEANAVPFDFIPGDNALRPEDGSSIDIICELGPATARQGVDIPSP